MEHISVKQASEKWGISVRRVQALCEQGRIPGATRFASLWLIPKASQKPLAPCQSKNMQRVAQLEEVLHLLSVIAAPMPNDNPDAVLNAICGERARRQFEATLSYLRGDFAHVISCFNNAKNDDILKGCLFPFAIAAAASLGKYDMCSEIEAHYEARIMLGTDDVLSRMEALSLSSVAISAYAPNMIPDWIKAGDFSFLPPSLLTNAFQNRARYLLYTGKPDAALAVAETALVLCPANNGITFHAIYLRLICATACYIMNLTEACEAHLTETMHICLPHGFITPLAEMLIDYGGLMEKCLQRFYPNSHDAVLSQWEKTIKNWIGFHNRFTKETLTSLLTKREIYIAQLAARRVSYAKIAEQQGISITSVKKNMQNIYAKLFITSRAELEKFVLPIKP